MDQKRFFIIDTMAMAFRNFHAFGQNQLRNSAGIPTSVVYGCLSFILKLLQDEKPDYLVFATDMRSKTFRHELFPQYKAHRTEMPEELVAQIPYLYELIEIIGCKLLRTPELEADDLIGSLAHQFASDQLKCFIVSGDKDFMQCVNGNVLLYSPQKGGEAKIIDGEGVFAKFGCTPQQVIDVLALMGDSSDNVPGVKGIGEKGAQALIQKYHSLENVYQHIDEISGKRQRDALVTNREMAFLSRQLVTIKIDAHLPYNLFDFSCTTADILTSRSLLEFCEKLELRTIAQRITSAITASGTTAYSSLFSQVFAPSEVGTAHSADTLAMPNQDTSFEHYKLVAEPQKFAELLTELREATQISFDTETTGLDIINDRPIGISLAVKPREAFYIPLVRQHTVLTEQEILAGLAPIFADPAKLKIGHNSKFDLQMLANIGLQVVGPFSDTMIISHLLESSARSNGLDACCLRYLNYQKITLASLIDKSKPQAMLDVNIDDLTRYACEDADLTLRLHQHLFPLMEAQNLINVANEVEMPLIPVLARMEQSGVFIDEKILSELSTQLDDMARILTAKIYEIAGEEFNINSPKQLQVILFEKLKIHEQLGHRKLKKTKSGYSTDVSVLEQLSEHPLAENILRFRTVTKLKNTYVDTLPQLINPKTGRIHTSFHQTGTSTGRLSSSDPNLQNIPIRSELGREIRLAFRAPSDDLCIISADYSQIELRILAHLAGEKALTEAFLNGEDIHLATAAKIFEVAKEAVTKEQRSAAKAINFGIIYGMGPNRLARETNMSQAKAKSFIEKYFATYPQIENYIKNMIAFAQQHEYTATITGRRRLLPEINSKNRMEQVGAQNVATNAPIQGSAADLIKIAMINLQKKLDESHLNVKMLLQVHDELVFECPKDLCDEAIAIIKSTMESAIKMDVPIEVGIGYGANWLDAH